MKPTTLAAIFTTAIIVAIAAINFPTTAQSPYNHRTTPVSAELPSGSLTATGPTGATTLTTLSTDCIEYSFENTTNVEIDALIGSTKKRVPATSFRQFEPGSGSTRLASGTVIKVFNTGTAPTSGWFEFYCQPY